MQLRRKRREKSNNVSKMRRHVGWRATSPLATCNIDCSPPSHATGCQQNATHATALNEKRGVSVLMAHLGLELSSTDINSTFGDSE